MPEEENKTPGTVQIRGQWVGVEDAVALVSNAFAVQCVKGEFFLTFGVMTPPIIAGPLTQEDADKLTMQVKPVARIGMSAERVIELIGLLQGQLRAYTQTELKS